jgi:hypothetical protein
MITLFFIFLVLVIVHFILEGIIAPSERSKIRLDLFALRDEIRRAKIEYGSEFNDELFSHMQSHTNKSIHLLHNYNIVGFYQGIRNEKAHQQAIARVDRFYELLFESNNPELQKFHIRNVLYTVKGLLVNSAGWGIYFFPFFVLAFAAYMVQKVVRSKALSAINSRIGRFIAGILELPEALFVRLFPPNESTWHERAI